MAQPRSSRKQRQLDAQAFRDAVRDILAVDGVFSLADEAEPDTVYHFDGVSWMREELPARALRLPRPAQIELAASTGG